MKINNLTNSVVRQSALLSALILPGHMLNFLFLILAGRILGTTDFGIFYTALSITNILIAPAIILNLFFAKNITLASVSTGIDGGVQEFRQYVGFSSKFGGILCAVSMACMIVIGCFTGAESTFLMMFIAVSVYAIYMTETTRAAFQGLKRFVSLGMTTLSWTTLRFILGLAGLYFIGSAWAGLAGILAAAIIIFLSCNHILMESSTEKFKARYNKGLYESRDMLLFCSSYGLLICMIYLDNMLAYMGLDRIDLGQYSSACVLGKSIVLFTTPIVQVFFPLIIEQNKQQEIETLTILKTVLTTILLSGFAVLVICLFSNFIGTTVLGLKEFNPGVIKAVAVSSIPLCLLRIVFLVQLSRGLNQFSFFLVPALLLQTGLLYFFKDDIANFAWAFAISCMAVLVYYTLVCVFSLRKDTITAHGQRALKTK
jgi:O-antigen/teichoic acid export membrane protein